MDKTTDLKRTDKLTLEEKPQEGAKKTPLTLSKHRSAKASGTVVLRRKRHVFHAPASSEQAEATQAMQPATPRVFTTRHAQAEVVENHPLPKHFQHIPESIEATVEAEVSAADECAPIQIEQKQAQVQEHHHLVAAHSAAAVPAHRKTVLAANKTQSSTVTTTAHEVETKAPHSPAPEGKTDDVEAELSELDVFKKIREINKRYKEEGGHDKHDDQDLFNEEFEDDTDEVSGMHFEHHHDQENSGSDDDVNEDDNDRENASHGQAMVRSAGNIGSFIRAASLVPLLTEEEELELARRLKEYNDLDAARKLVMSHLRLVVSVARGYMGYGLPLSDLIQEGNIGLMKAVHHFQPDMGGRLAAFAVHWIKAEIHDYVIRNWRMVKVATTKAQRKLFFKLRQNKKRLGWFTENERLEVARDLDVSPTDVAEMETRLAGSDIGFDLDEDDGADKGVAVTLSPSSYLEDENSNFAQAYEQSDYASWELHKLKDAMAQLDERSRYILKRRWLDETKATLQELSNELKVSIERVRQIENNAMNKVKLMLVDEGITGESSKKSTALVVVPKKKRVRKSTKKQPKVETQSPEVILAQGPALKALKAPEKKPLKHVPVVVDQNA